MLKKIILHWTAGRNFPNQVDLEHYHYVIDGGGKIYLGKFSPESNVVCKSGQYAMHTKLGNTGSIGVSMCGMQGYINPFRIGKYPITKQQVEKCFSLCAKLCKKYSIQPIKGNITTHYHFNQKHNIKTGKIDINFLPPYSFIKDFEMEDFMIDKIKWYFKCKD